MDLLNTINETKRKYIAKVKGNQEGLRAKAKETIDTDSYRNYIYTIEGNDGVCRTVDIFESSLVT